MRHLATFALGAVAGALLALLLTQPVTSRPASTPRPAATILATLRPVASLRTGAPITSPSAENTHACPRGPGCPREHSPSATIGTRSASPEAQPSAKPTAAPTPKPTKRPRATVRPSEALSGTATWYSYRRGQAAAGPRLRAALGAGWRGETVLVNGVPVVLSDYMGTRNRAKVIDLDDGLFRAICGDLSLGVCEVEVRW